MKRIAIFFVITAFGFLQIGFGQTVNLNLKDSIALDSRVQYGKFDNGFSYFLCKHDVPQGKVVVRLVVDAGFQDEEIDQYELAHLIEHLPFSGTEHFTDPFAYFESNGVQKGKDINASTGDSRTTYDLILPAENDKLFDDGLLFLKDCAQGFIFDTTKINKEREAVLNEHIFKSSLSQKIRKEYIIELIGRNRFSVRDAADTRQSIKYSSFEAIKRFYKKWYRPSLQAIIIVGDIDVYSAKDKIENVFATLPTTDHAESRESVSVKVPSNATFSRVRSKDYNDIELSIFLNRELTFRPVTYEDYAKIASRELFNLMIQERFKDLSADSVPGTQAPWCRYVDRLNVVGPDLSCINLTLFPRWNSIRNDFQKAIEVLESAKQDGFSENEFKQAKAAFLSGLPSDHETSRDIAEGLVNYFSDSTPAPSRRTYLALQKSILEQINVQAINSSVAEWIDFSACHFTLIGPENSKSLPESQQLTDWWAEIRKRDRKGYQVKQYSDKLMSADELELIKTELGYRIIKDDDKHSQRIVLKNGVNLVLLSKPEFSNQHVFIHGFSEGGYATLSTYPIYHRLKLIGYHGRHQLYCIRI
jgi:zinc protease